VRDGRKSGEVRENRSKASRSLLLGAVEGAIAWPADCSKPARQCSVQSAGVAAGRDGEILRATKTLAERGIDAQQRDAGVAREISRYPLASQLFSSAARRGQRNSASGR